MRERSGFSFFFGHSPPPAAILAWTAANSFSDMVATLVVAASVLASAASRSPLATRPSWFPVASTHDTRLTPRLTSDGHRCAHERTRLELRARSQAQRGQSDAFA